MRRIATLTVSIKHLGREAGRNHASVGCLRAARPAALRSFRHMFFKHVRSLVLCYLLTTTLVIGADQIRQRIFWLSVPLILFCVLDLVHNLYHEAVPL